MNPNLSQAGREDFIVLGLIARAEMYRVQKHWSKARLDLQEGMTRAKRSGMALCQIDAHLEYTRFFLTQDQPFEARNHLAIAKSMIEEIGYNRRKQEILNLADRLRRIH